MDKKLIIVGDKEYTVEIASTEQQQKEGLSNREFLAKDAGMLFVYDKIKMSLVIYENFLVIK